MKKVLKRLKEYKNRIDLNNRFDYNFETDNQIFTPMESKLLSEIKNSYKRNIELKGLLKNKYENGSDKDNIDIDFWIINEWGGIKGFKKNDRNISKIQTFKAQLKKGKLTKDTFGTISSLSKLSSFMYPEEYVIYDSRVIYTLNWLILTTENKDGLNNIYFPMPAGRNKIIADFDMNTIIHLTHIDPYINGTPLFISYKEAYFKFCKFIKHGTIELFDNGSKPYQLEMLLFTLADKEIYKEIKEKIKINTANNG